MDDGETFAFQQGEYLHITFTFLHNTLSAAVSPKSPMSTSAVALPDTAYLEARVERLIILGSNHKQQLSHAEINGHHLSMNVEKTPSGSWKAVVKDPGAFGAMVGKSWIVKFS